MDFINPAVTDGVDLFVNIMIFLIAFVTAISAINVRKENQKSKD